ncbi:MAG: aldehyde dehydrogenase family protein [Actinomycetota bacterium]
MAVAEREAQLAPEARAFLSEPKKMFIGGEWVDAASGETFATIDPALDEEITQVPLAGAEDVARAVKAARDAFESGKWSNLEPRKRAGVLYKIADAIQSKAAALAQIETLDQGKPVAFALGEMIHSAFVFRYYAGWCDKVYGETNPTGTDQFIYTLRDPVGVCAQIIPWNFPLVMASWKVAPALAFGNTSVLKPAEETPLTALWLAKIAQEAGVPDGVLNVITGPGEPTGAALTSSPVDKIAFTGSTEVGKLIMAEASKTLARVSLELGGKSPNTVFPDADMTKAIPQSAFGIFMNAGQVCTAGSRLLVEEKVHDEVVDGLVGAAGTWKVGDGLETTTMVGPLVSRTQLERVSKYLEVGPSEGAQVRLGGHPMEGKGYFVEPTIFTGVNPDMRIAQEEIFGPVLSVIPFKDIDDAIRIANNTMYGLAAAVWTRDLSTAHRMARGIRAGTVWVNNYGGSDPGVSFGGYKQSGFGRELGIHSIEMYTSTKSVWVSL